MLIVKCKLTSCLLEFLYNLTYNQDKLFSEYGIINNPKGWWLYWTVMIDVMKS